ncbi:Ig-like domain repeat protein [Mumia sp. DW29H23]|uniref:Ig-like domain repeat protein n=1 Tax=Mumia sp. DW29H23 TaxID=3421241 RepID=UPI003D6996FE
MKTLTRVAAAATSTVLAAGVLAFSPASAQHVEAGGIEIWGATAASFPQAGGPYKAFSSYAGTDTFAIGLDDKLVALPGVRAGLAVPSNPAAPAGDVAGTTVRSVSVGHVQGAWAVTADGALHKWGGARGTVIPDNTWTASQLGDEAMEVVGGGGSATVRLKNGRAVLVDAFGVTPCAESGQPLSGVKQVGGFSGLLLDGGRVVSVDSVCNGTTVIPANVGDPVVHVSENYATTASGRILQYKVAGTPEAANVPTFVGKAVEAVRADSDYSALLTDQGEVVVWRHSDGSPVSTVPGYVPPAALNGRAAVALRTAGNSIAVLYADVANQAKPVVSGAARVGSTLSASEGDWLGAPTSLSYQWLAGDDEIAGADDATFIPTENELGKTLKVRVTATRGDQEVSAISNPTAAVAEAGAALEATSKPTIAGTAQVGQTLTGTPAVFNDAAATVTNQWLAGGAPIVGASGTTLKLAAAQLGKAISFRSTATLGGETAQSVSDPTAAVAAAPKVNAAVGVSATGGRYGASARVTVRVSAAAATSGTVTLQGVGPAQRQSVRNGVATFSLPRTLSPRRYTVSAAYSGNGAVNARSATGVLSVAKGQTGKPSFKVTKMPTRTKKGKATVTIRTASGLVKASGRVTITLKKGKKTIRVGATVRGGKVTVKLPKLARGNYKVKVVYGGNSYYLAATSATYKVKVRK